MNLKRLTIYLYLLIVPSIALCQSDINRFLTPSDSLNNARLKGVIITESTVFTLSLIGLNELWYKDYDRSSFHFNNDSGQWLQLDKLGHVYSSYQIGRLGANILDWTGLDKKNRLLYGGTLGLTLLTTVEIFDGFSDEWGFSWSDMAANVAGTGLYIGQELLWDEQRILMKYSYHSTQYAEQRPGTLGDGIFEEFIKDYNGQTYWLSFNLKSFFKQSKLPAWLNVAMGYGGEGMLTGNGEPIDGMFFEQYRERQYYLSMDIDFSKIKTNSHFLKTIFDVFNTLKLPFPALEYTDKNGFKLRGIYF